MKDTGFVKIYRKLLENPISGNLELLGLVTALLLKANHKSNSFFLGKTKMTVKPGQFISSQEKLAIEFGVHRNKLIRMLKILEDEKIVNTKGYNKYSLFTMVNWSKYQTQGTPNDTTNDTTSEQPANTNKNDNNDEEGREKILQARSQCSELLIGGGYAGFSIPLRRSDDLEDARKKLNKKKIGYDDYVLALRRYAKDITERDKTNSYGKHRFKLLEFLTRKGGLVTFI